MEGSHRPIGIAVADERPLAGRIVGWMFIVGLMLVLAFAAYFFPAREAWPYLGVVLLLAALPFAYDATALEQVRDSGSVRVSAGWVVSTYGTDRLLIEADQALAAAKRSGKDRALAYA